MHNSICISYSSKTGQFGSQNDHLQHPSITFGLIIAGMAFTAFLICTQLFVREDHKQE